MASSKVRSILSEPGHRLFFELAELLSEPVIALDEDMRILGLNAAAQSLTGRSFEDSAGQHVVDALGQTGYGHTMARLARTALSSTSTVTARMTASRGERTATHWKIRARAIGTGRDRLVILVATLENWFTNATSYADVSATGSPEHFRVLVDLLPDMVFEWDERGHILYANAMVSEVLGYTPEELSQKTMTDLVREDERRRFRETLQQMLSGELLHRGLLFHLLGADDSEFLSEVSAIVIHGPDIQSRILAIARDHTKRALLEKRLRLSEARYRQLFDCSRDLIFSLDPAGNVLDVNQMGPALTGKARHEILGKPFTRLVLEADRKAFTQALQQACAGGALDVEVRLEGLAGRQRILEVALAPVFERGRVALVHGTARDVTERRELEREVQQLQKLESLGRLAAGVAHDFNNILGAIIGLATVLRDELSEDHPLQSDVDGILKAAHQGAEITNQILSFAQARPQRRVRLDLNKVAREVVELISYSLPPVTSISFRPDPMPLWVEADPGQIRQVVLNLCVNARDAMPSGGHIRVTTSRGEDERGRRWAEIAVADDGPGVPESIRQKIFEPFFTTKDTGESLGLGLSVCWGIVRNHGGTIRVDSNRGGGSVFRIRLPAFRGEALSGEQPVMGSVASVQPAKRVLVIDDQELMRRAASRMLSRLGYDVETAGSWEEVHELLEEAEHGSPFDLFLLDLAIPGVDGYTIYARLKERLGDPVVVAISGFYSDELVEELLSKGVRGFLKKPFTRRELESLLQQVLRGSQ